MSNIKYRRHTLIDNVQLVRQQVVGGCMVAGFTTIL